MMDIRKIAVISLGITSCCFSLVAQEKWSLSQCIDYAVQNNIQVKQKQLEKENSEIRLNTTRMSRLPDLTGSAGQDFSDGVLHVQEFMKTNLNLQHHFAYHRHSLYLQDLRYRVRSVRPGST